MEEKEFKDYKEKQNYYKERAKQEKVLWVSKEPDYGNNKNTIMKGRTYINPERQVKKLKKKEGIK